MLKLEPNKYYHIYNRGNNKERLFYSPDNYEYFLSKFNHHCFHVFNTYCYCLMSNHFHFLNFDEDSFLNREKVMELFGGLVNFEAAHSENIFDVEVF